MRCNPLRRGGAAPIPARPQGPVPLEAEAQGQASLRSSTSRLANLYHRSELALDDFIEHLYTARSITQERSAALRTPAGAGAERWWKNKMRYFFAVLADRLGLREPAASD